MNLAPRAIVAKETHPLQDFREGLSYAFGFKPTRLILLLLTVSSLVGIPFTVLLPAVATQTLGGGPRTLGYLMAATGAGAWLFAHPFLTSHTAHLTVPLLGALHVPSAFFFDLGVFSLVVGATGLILIALGHQSIRHPWS